MSKENQSEWIDSSQQMRVSRATKNYCHKLSNFRVSLEKPGLHFPRPFSNNSSNRQKSSNLTNAKWRPETHTHSHCLGGLSNVCFAWIALKLGKVFAKLLLQLLLSIVGGTTKCSDSQKKRKVDREREEKHCTEEHEKKIINSFDK